MVIITQQLSHLIWTKIKPNKVVNNYNLVKISLIRVVESLFVGTQIWKPKL